MTEHVREYTVDLLNELCAGHGLSPIQIELKNSWDAVPLNLLIEFERLVASFPTKRDINRCENIFGLYRRGSD